ncbi:MAG: glyoxalase/bleomycin resistance/extradiol dioxygenase family protein [SAR324 cluster bacterium]|nr:glyoxalase/bleomycin resistance/extradiol dioxygenase family protein [SAR324 cluster bacterium]
MNFYKECFNGEIVNMGRYGDSPMEVAESHKNKILHIELKFWGGSILASDNIDSAESSKTNSSSIQLSLGFKDPLKMENTFNCLKQDGQVTMELKEQFWGDKFGMLTDKFGIKWMFNCPKKETAIED